MSLMDMVAGVDPIQADRILRIETPLGLDQVLPERFELSEGISGFEAEGTIRPGEAGLFSGTIAVRSPRHDIAASELVGRYVDVSLELSAEPPVRRTWHCLVSELLVGPPVTRGMRSYRLTLRPPHWLLTRRRDCRIWQNMTSVEVAQTLLREHGLPAPITNGVINEPPPQAYSAQFNESDWAFMCRRLEQDGLWTFTSHSGGKKGAVAATCDLHLASFVSGYTNCPYENARVRYSAGSTDRNHITCFDTAFRFVPGSRAGADWNFLMPGTVPGADDSIPSHVKLPGGALGSNAEYESYEYPSVGGYGTGQGADGASEGIDHAELDRLERLRAQAHEAEHAQVTGEGTVRTLAPGQRFTPYDLPAEMGLAELLGSASDGSTDFAEHVVLSITHRAVDQSYESQGGAPEYGCTFMALPATTPATPHRNTPRPRIDGQQIAIVAGPEGEEIHTDRFGRVKLWFPWDRRAAKDGTDTCWVRVAQSWAGSGWGAQVIPRIGMEAVVSYLDGDPDRPLVTGLVPNPSTKVPYELPANKTKSVFRTNTHKSGNSRQFNEFSFEDARGAENVAMHAQKDQTLKILNNRMKRVDNDQVESIGCNKSVEVSGNHQERVGGSVNLTVGGGKSPLFATLAGVAAKAMNDAMNVAQEAGDATIPAFLGGAVAMTAGAEAASIPLITGFDRAGRNALVGGAEQAATGTALGSALGGVMPMSGVVTRTVERFVSDTIGLARTEQIGVFKNTMVGAVENRTIGSKQFTKVGDEQRLRVGRLRTMEVGDEYTAHSGRRTAQSSGNLFSISAQEKFEGTSKTWEVKADDVLLLAAPGGYVEISKRGVKIRGLKVDIEGNAINFRRGGSGEGSKCLRAMAATATPFVR